MILVKEFALRQLHWLIQKDPWTQAVMLAGGRELNTLAERILAMWYFNDFTRLNEQQCAYYERLLGISGKGLTLEERRAAIQTAWKIGDKPTLLRMQMICDGWQQGGVLVTYEPGTIHFYFLGEFGTPKNLDALKKLIERMAPAHLILDWAFRYLLVREVHEVMTIDQINAELMDHFAGG